MRRRSSVAFCFLNRAMLAVASSIRSLRRRAAGELPQASASRPSKTLYVTAAVPSTMSRS